MIDRKNFYDVVRAKVFGGTLTDAQVLGMNAILDEWTAHHNEVADDIRWLAYMLATAAWETNRQMQPVVEAYWLSEQWRKVNLRYYPWHGRGLVQLTWEDNYKKMDAALGLDGALVANPDLALDPEVGSDIMFYGMEHGSFTGKKLADFFNGANEAPYGARSIINGFDKANEIAALYYSFKEALGCSQPSSLS